MYSLSLSWHRKIITTTIGNKSNETCKVGSSKLNSIPSVRGENKWLQTNCKALHLRLSNLFWAREEWCEFLKHQRTLLAEKKEKRLFRCQAFILLRVLSVMGKEKSLNNDHIQFPGIGCDDSQ